MSGAALQLHKDSPQFDQDQLALIKSTVAKGTTNDELSLFLYTAKRTGLDPLMKQIHAIKRWSSRDGRDVMSIQTGIDGLRLIADRTGRYAPGPEPVVEEGNQTVYKATAYVKKQVGNEWHTIGATAYYEEYVQTNKEGKPIGLWAKMPRLMTAKCAEALALRKAFPAEMSGVYTFDEMTQADSEPVVAPVGPPAALKAATPAPETPKAAPAPAPAAGKEPEKSIEELRHDLGELAQIAVEAGIYSTTGDAIQDFASDDKFKSKCRDAAGMQKDWAIKKAITKANAVLNTPHPAKDAGDDQDIPL